MRFARHGGFDFLVNVIYGRLFWREPRFEVVYHLRSMATRTGCASRWACTKKKADLDAEVLTVSDLWQTANWQEREGLRRVRGRSSPAARICVGF